MAVVVQWPHCPPTRRPRIPQGVAVRRQVPRSRGASRSSPRVPSSDLTPQSPHSLKLPFDLVSGDSPGMRDAEDRMD